MPPAHYLTDMFKPGGKGYILRMANETWGDFVKRATANLSQRQIAEKTALDQTGISRWIRGQRPRAEKAVEFARALNLSPIEALIAAGYLEPEDVPDSIHIRGTISDYTTMELIDELRRRAVEE